MLHSAQPVLTARKIRKRLGDRDVLDGVDLTVAPGEFLAVMGPSGSGKSTLLYALSGMDSLDGGTVEFDGEDLGTKSQDALSELRLHRMGFVFQQIHLLKNLSLLDNVVLPGFQAKAAPRAEVVSRARELMNQAGVAELFDRDITQVSGGQMQRVGVCRALVNSPAIVFADEPTGALDSRAAQGVLKLLTDVCRDGIALTLVTHDSWVAARAERVITMVDGHIAGELTLGLLGDEDAELADRHARVTAWFDEVTQHHRN